MAGFRQIASPLHTKASMMRLQYRLRCKVDHEQYLDLLLSASVAQPNALQVDTKPALSMTTFTQFYHNQGIIQGQAQHSTACNELQLGVSYSTPTFAQLVTIVNACIQTSSNPLNSSAEA